jgi:SPW repeat
MTRPHPLEPPPQRPRRVTPRQRLPLAAGAVMLWIAVAPWLWGFSHSRPAVANHIFFTLAFGPLALMIAVLRPAAVVALVGGLWLAVSPWVLGYATTEAAWLSELVSGGLLVVLSGHAVGSGRSVRQRAHRPPVRARVRTHAAVEAGHGQP